MAYADTFTLLNLIDSADAQGVIHLSPTDEYGTAKNQATLRKCILAELYGNNLALLRLERVKKSITEIDANAFFGPDGLEVSLNLAKLFMLPSKAPAAELAELRALFAAIAEQMSATPALRADVQLCNNRDRNKRVYGSLAYRIPAEQPRQMQHVPEVTAALNARIAASPALTHWLRNVALELQRIGPWSWICIDDNALFEPGQDPHFQHLMKTLAPRSADQPPIQYEPL